MFACTHTLWASTLIKGSLKESGLCGSQNTAITAYGVLLYRRQWGCGVLNCGALLLVIWGRVMNLNISKSIHCNYVRRIITNRHSAETHTHRQTEMYMHAPTQAHTVCNLSITETTHSAALTPRLGARTTIPLACQSCKLYTRVIPAALRMVGNKSCRNERGKRPRVKVREKSYWPYGLQ